MSLKIEQYVPVVRIAGGINSDLPVDVTNGLIALGTTTAEDIVCDTLTVGGSPVGSTAIISGQTSPITITTAQAGNTFLLDNTNGLIFILPTATGSGSVYHFTVSILATSNEYIIKVPNASTVMIGLISALADDSSSQTGFIAASDSDTITLNRSTTGSVSKGEWIEINDIETNIFSVKGYITYDHNVGNGTPFSATV